LTAATAWQLTRLPTKVLDVLTVASRAELTRPWPTDRARSLLDSIFSRPGSMWRDAVPCPPLPAWMINHPGTKAAYAWECAPSPPFARAGRDPAAKLSKTTTLRTLYAATGSAVSCKAAMTRRQEFCANSWAAWACPLAKKGDTLSLRTATPTAPSHAGNFTATCAPALATFSPTSRSSIHRQLLIVVLPPALLAMPRLFGMPTVMIHAC
jgi:hypothetical protein